MHRPFRSLSRLRMLATRLACSTLVAVPINAQGPTAPAARSSITDGEFTSWYENGVVCEQGPVGERGERIGAWRWHWPNGRLAASGRYSDGERFGPWVWRDQYGRAVQRIWFETRPRAENPVPEKNLLPLTIADLRDGIVGMTTVGELSDRFAKTSDDAAGSAERAAIARQLADAPPEAVGVPLALAEAALPQQRAIWLELMASMPMPKSLPTEQLLAWRDDELCSAAATAVLTAWSQQFAPEWQPLVTAGADVGGHWQLAEQLGTKAFAAVPELRRRMAAGTIRSNAGYVLVRILGLGPSSVLSPWITALESSDAGRRAEAAQVLQEVVAKGWRDAAEVSNDTILRLLADECPAVADGASRLLWHAMRHSPSRFDTQLDRIARSPSASARVAAASRLCVLGRSEAAEALWRDVAEHEPSALDHLDGWDLWARHTTDAAALRKRLLAAIDAGETRFVSQLLLVAGEEETVIERLVAIARQQQVAFRSDLPPALCKRLRERLLPVFDDALLPAAERRTVFVNLCALSTDDASLRGLIERGLADSDPSMRTFTCGYADRRDLVLDPELWRRLFEDPETQSAALGLIDHRPLPPNLDLLPYPVSSAALATWADGHKERILRLFYAWLDGRPQAWEALRLLRPDLRSVEPLVPLPGSRELPPRFHEIRHQLTELFPNASAEWRIDAALAHRSGAGGLCVIGIPREVDELQLLQPIDAALLAAVQRRLLDPTIPKRQEALRLLAILGADGASFLPAVEAAIPGLAPAELALLPGAVCAIAPQAALRLCSPLLEHPDPLVVTAAVLGPERALRSSAIERWPGGGAFVRRIVPHLVTCVGVPRPSAWFRWFEDSIEALPDLRAALRKHPSDHRIAAAIIDLGPAAAEAAPDLLLILQYNGGLTPNLVAMLPPEVRLRAWLPMLATNLGDAALTGLRDLRVEDAEALASLEQLASGKNTAAATRARELLLRSRSESATADAARLEWIHRGTHSVLEIEERQLVRLWPRLGTDARRSVLGLLRSRPALLSEPMADLVAAELEEQDIDGSAFGLLLAGAPLHARVLELVDTSDLTWSPLSLEAESSLRSRHIRALLRLWRAGDAEYRDAALPWLRDLAPATVEMLQRLQLGDLRDPASAWKPQQVIELLERLAVPEAQSALWQWLHHEDLAIRRAALRAWFACRGSDDDTRRALHAMVLAIPFEQRFGPTEGLPPVIHAMLDALPSVTERVARLRDRMAERPSDAATAICADLAAARFLIPELGQLLQPSNRELHPLVLRCLQAIGTEAASLLPLVETLVRVPATHFEAQATVRALRGETPAYRTPR